MNSTVQMDQFLLNLSEAKELPAIEIPVYVAIGQNVVLICKQQVETYFKAARCKMRRAGLKYYLMEMGENRGEEHIYVERSETVDAFANERAGGVSVPSRRAGLSVVCC